MLPDVQPSYRWDYEFPTGFSPDKPNSKGFRGGNLLAVFVSESKTNPEIVPSIKPINDLSFYDIAPSTQ